jgi:hypothetical protein
VESSVIISKKFPIPNAGRWIEKAIKRSGSQAELARRLEEQAKVRCYPQKVNEWRMRGIVPPYWVRHLAAILEVDPKEIDPLLYG